MIAERLSSVFCWSENRSVLFVNLCFHSLIRTVDVRTYDDLILQKQPDQRQHFLTDPFIFKQHVMSVFKGEHLFLR